MISIAGRDIRVCFDDGVEALSDLDFQVDEREFVAIVGPSGCGKSTLLRLVAGLTVPSEGTLSVSGAQASGSGRGRETGLAYVLQDPTLLPWRHAEGNVALPLELRGLPDDEIERRVADVIDMVGLAGFGRSFPHQLSGGMRMRVSIARAMALAPELLMMDEPFGALDAISRMRLNEELLGLWDEHRWTCLFVTHSVQEAVFLSQRVLVMSARPGRMLADFTVPFPFPRSRSLRSDPHFVELAAAVSGRLEDS